MNNLKNVILDNDGDAIDLNNISAIYSLKEEDDCLYFNLRYNNGEETRLIFMLSDYAENKETLMAKMNAIRMDIIKQWNGGNEPVTFFNKIDLKKQAKTVPSVEA